MIRQESMLNVADNTGGKKINAWWVLGSGNPVCGQETHQPPVLKKPPGGVVKKDVVRAVIVRTKDDIAS